MRELKFRAWDRKEKRWVYCCLGPAQLLWALPAWTSQSFTKEGVVIFDNLEEWCQFTGLLDKNGLRIYEGDICKFSNWEKPKPIHWVDGRYMFGDTLVIVCKMECDDMEIVGNIYENLELL